MRSPIGFRAAARFVLFIAVAIALIGGLSVDSAMARDWYVNNIAGDDLLDGSQPRPLSAGGGPLRTITKALARASAGDTIILVDTNLPYRESITICGNRMSGYLDRPLRIIGDGAVLDGSRPVPGMLWEYYKDNVFRFQPEGQDHSLLFLDGKPAPRVYPEYGAASPPALQPLQWAHVEEYIYFCVEPDRTPDDYDVSYAYRDTGITLYHVENVEILDLTVQGFRLDGIAAANTARNITIAGCTLRGCGRAGLSVSGASDVTLAASLIGNNGRAQLLTLPGSCTQLVKADLLSNTAPAWVNQGGRVYVGGVLIIGGREEITPEMVAEPGEGPPIVEMTPEAMPEVAQPVTTEEPVTTEGPVMTLPPPIGEPITSPPATGELTPAMTEPAGEPITPPQPPLEPTPALPQPTGETTPALTEPAEEPTPAPPKPTGEPTPAPPQPENPFQRLQPSDPFQPSSPVDPFQASPRPVVDPFATGPASPRALNGQEAQVLPGADFDPGTLREAPDPRQ